jgi:GAF domain-containing protein
VAERKWAETLQQGRNKVLGRLATGGSLEDVLALLITTSEDLNPGMIGSVLLLDDEGKHLLHGAAPILPDFYNEAIHGLEIGDGVGSCGTAAFTGETVIVDDVMSHPFWADFRDLTAKAGLKACWSQPILSSDNKVLGTFAMYYQEPREPTAQELEFMQGIGNLASISIERKRAKTIQERLTQAIETVPVGVALFDHDDRLVFFNDRYRELMKVADDVLKPGVTFETMIRTMVERDPVKDAQGREEDFIRDRVNTTATPKVLLIFAGKISG